MGRIGGRHRPVLVVTRNEAIPVLSRILVGPVTRTIREIPTEVRLGKEDGLPEPCAASLDNLQPVPKSFLTGRLGSISYRRYEIRAADNSPHSAEPREDARTSASPGELPRVTCESRAQATTARTAKPGNHQMVRYRLLRVQRSMKPRSGGW